MPITKASGNSVTAAAKGDLVVGNATNDSGILSVGANGETLVADSSASTGLRWTATPSASNPVINGAFDIWQRGTSGSNNSTSGAGCNADRWTNYLGSGAITVSRQATGDTTNLPNIQYCARVQRNSGNAAVGNFFMINAFETANSIPYAGKTVTLSFYARRGANFSATSNILTTVLQSGTGTDQNPYNGFSGSTDVIAQNVTLTTTWQRFSFTGTIASTATQLCIQFYYGTTGTAGANDYYEVTGVQLDVGNVALPFRRAGGTLAGELAACQRYYWRNTVGSAGTFPQYSRLASGSSINTANKSVLMIPLKQTMRTGPTAVEYGGSVRMYDGNGDTGVTDLTLDSSNLNVVILIATTSTDIADFRPVYLYADNNSNTYLGFSAEL